MQRRWGVFLGASSHGRELIGNTVSEYQRAGEEEEEGTLIKTHPKPPMSETCYDPKVRLFAGENTGET